ncbi:MAG TPA: dihydroneopterin aldolase [Polyangiaceae bacterium]|nr:dihydroneopterin aldolase [Polyangiaceae bacterium]
MDSIRITGLELSCIVGVRPAERRKPQRIRIDLTLGLDLSEAGRTGRISHTVDYSVVAEQIGHLLHFREYRLIEMASEELTVMLLGVYPAVERVTVQLEKPEALRGYAACAAVSITRERSARRRVAREFGEEEPLLDTEEAALSLLHVDAGKKLSRADGTDQHLEWLVQGHLHASGRSLRHHDPRDLAGHGELSNPGPERATLFSCLLRRGQ